MSMYSYYRAYTLALSKMYEWMFWSRQPPSLIMEASNKKCIIFEGGIIMYSHHLIRKDYNGIAFYPYC